MKEFDPIADLYVCEQTSPIDNTVSSLDVRKAGGDTVARFDTYFHQPYALLIKHITQRVFHYRFYT